MKRVLSLFLILCLVFALTGCMSDEERQSRKEALNALNGGETEYSLSTGTTLENQELFDGRNVIVQLAGITGTPEYPELKLAVRNGTRENLNFSINSLVINGWEVDGWLDLYDVSPRTVTMGTIQCGSDLSLCGVTDISSVELSFEIYDGDYDTLASVSCSMETSYTGQDQEEYVPEGITLLEADGIVVQAAGLDTSDSGTILSLYVENGTGRTISLEALQARWNGEPVELSFYDRVSPGCRRMVSQWIYTEDDYEDVLMLDGDLLAFQLKVMDWDTGIALNEAQVSLDPAQF